MKCAVPPIGSFSDFPFLDPSPGRSMTRARRLFVSRINKLRESDLRDRASIKNMQVKNRPFSRFFSRFHQTVHMKCAVSLKPSSPNPKYPNYLQRKTKRLVAPRPKPRTQYDTSATSLRKQNSKLPLKRPTPNTGQCTRMCTAANAPRMALLAGNPFPKAGSLNG